MVCLTQSIGRENVYEQKYREIHRIDCLGMKNDIFYKKYIPTDQWSNL